MTSSLVVAGLAISLALSAIESGPRRAAPQAGQRQPGDRRPTPWPRGEHPPRGQVADGIDQFRTQPVELASNVVIMSGRFATCSCPPADRWAKLFGTRRQPGHPSNAGCTSAVGDLAGQPVGQMRARSAGVILPPLQLTSVGVEAVDGTDIPRSLDSPA